MVCLDFFFRCSKTEWKRVRALLNKGKEVFHEEGGPPVVPVLWRRMFHMCLNRINSGHLQVPGETRLSWCLVRSTVLWISKHAFSFLCSFSKELCLQHGRSSWRNYSSVAAPFLFPFEGIKSQSSSDFLRSHSSAPAAATWGWVHFAHVALLG